MLAAARSVQGEEPDTSQREEGSLSGRGIKGQQLRTLQGCEMSLNPNPA